MKGELTVSEKLEGFPRERIDYPFMFEQSRIHFRHLETLRTQYLGFFFTVMIASVTVATSLLKDAETTNMSTVVFGILILIFVDFILSLNILVAVIKFGFARTHHQKMINGAAKMFGFSRESTDFPDSPNDNKTYQSEIFERSTFSVQKSAEFVLFMSSTLLATSLVGVGLFVANSTSIGFHEWQSIIGWIAGVVSAFYSYKILYPIVISKVLK